MEINLRKKCILDYIWIILVKPKNIYMRFHTSKNSNNETGVTESKAILLKL